MFRVADVNGDGKPEVLFLQSAGAHANEAFDPRYPELDYYKTGVEDQELFCLTLVDGSGDILWQTGTPWAEDRPFSWNGHWGRFCDLVDLDGDGKTEILLVHKDELRVYDATDGHLKNTRKLPNSGFNYTRTVRIDDSGQYTRVHQEWHLLTGAQLRQSNAHAEPSSGNGLDEAGGGRRAPGKLRRRRLRRFRRIADRIQSLRPRRHTDLVTRPAVRG
jgi:hypothetical protein